MSVLLEVIAGLITLLLLVGGALGVQILRRIRHQDNRINDLEEIVYGNRTDESDFGVKGRIRDLEQQQTQDEASDEDRS